MAASLTVSMAYFGCPDLVGRAVHSILGQTYTDLRLVVVGDGDPVPALPADPRLVVLDLPANRGPYYCDAVTLAACDTAWYSIHAADDWSEPDRLARLMAATGPDLDAVFGGSLEHRGDQVERRWTRFRMLRPGELHHVASSATGIYRTEALRSVGGPHPDFRVTYDTMLVRLVLDNLRWLHLDDEWGYHRVVRPDSLTRNPATGFHSRYRDGWRRRRDRLYRELHSTPRDEWLRVLAPSPAVAEAMKADVHRLRQLQAQVPA